MTATRWWARVRRLWALGTVLAVAVLVVPDPSVHTGAVLVGVDTAGAVDHPKDVVWVLALGSDARPGENPLRSRADAIQLVGVNLRTGSAAAIGVPRDSWVTIPGVGSDRVNAALTHGGPQLMGETVARLVGIRPDYVVVTTFPGFRSMIRAIGGVTVQSRLAFTDDGMEGRIHRGANRLDGTGALFFSRARHFLPRGDFDRSANQQELLRAILREVRVRADDPGFLERALLSVLENLTTTLSPAELFRFAQAATTIDPSRFRGCVVPGSIGYAGAASVVFPDVAAARRLGDAARSTARLPQGC